MRYMVLMGLALAAAAPAAAQDASPERSFAWRVNDEIAPPDPSHASKNGFGLQMVVTPDYEGFWRAWEGPTPPHLPVTGRIERGKPVHAMLIFSGCRAAADGNCNLTAVFTITSPDGSAYGEAHTGRVWGGPPAPGYNLQLSEGSVGLIVEPHEPLGRYTFKASVTDHVANLTVEVEGPVEAIEARTTSAR
jgi:hypothetical protein